jgi:hypothetical protein
MFRGATSFAQRVTLDVTGLTDPAHARGMFDGCPPLAGVDPRGTVLPSIKRELGDRLPGARRRPRS